jgi:hypothetical protein
LTLYRLVGVSSCFLGNLYGNIFLRKVCKHIMTRKRQPWNVMLLEKCSNPGNVVTYHKETSVLEKLCLFYLMYFVFCVYVVEHSTKIQNTSWFLPETWVSREIRPCCDSESLLLKKMNKLTIQAKLQTAENIDLCFLLTLKWVVIFYVKVSTVTVKKVFGVRCIRIKHL